MKEIVRSILEMRGYELADKGKWLIAEKDGLRLNIGFLSRKRLKPSELEHMKGKNIIITSDDRERFKDVRNVVVLDQKELYNDFTKVLFGEKDFESSIFYEHISSGDTWEDFTVTPTSESGENIIRPFMTLPDVVELSKKSVKGFRYVLELVPHYLFHFSCELLPNDGPSMSDGLIGVNALTRKCEFWNQNFETVDSLNHVHKKIEPKVSEGEAKDLAKKFAIEQSTTVVENIKEKEHTVVTEKKVIRPRDDELVIDDRGLFYLPIWCVEGTNGVMIVNAAAGKIIEEDYYVK
jgi:hypothetical protein